MTGAFNNCTSLTTAPVIPSGVTDIGGLFSGCESLTTAPVIPSGVTNMNNTFNKCTSLTGNIEINANPSSYDYCFYKTSQPIFITGSCPEATKMALAKTSKAGNVTY